MRNSNLLELDNNNNSRLSSLDTEIIRKIHEEVKDAMNMFSRKTKQMVLEKVDAI